MSRITSFPWFFFPLSFWGLAGCVQQMAQQPSYRPLEPSPFFPDGRSARPLVPGTVARGQLREDTHLYTGRRDPAMEWTNGPRAIGIAGSGNLASVLALGATLGESSYVDVFPFPVTRQVLERGRERYTIFCIHCHGSRGLGDGKIVERGFTQPPAFYKNRSNPEYLSRGFRQRGIILPLPQAPVGYYFDVITNGYGAMPDHAAQIPPRDRWAISAYIRTLQLSHQEPEEEQATVSAREVRP